MNQKINLILVHLTLLLISGCADTYINPVEQQTIVVNAEKQALAAINKVKFANQNSPIKSQAIINFIGKITAKKTNDLTSYIHKQMNEGVKEFVITLNSSGGDSDAAIAAYQYLQQLPVVISTYNIGNVQSSAALLYCSGQKRYALPYSFFMLHGSSTTYTESMSLSEIESLLKLGKIHRQAFVEIIKFCTNVSASTLESYFSSADAKYITVPEAAEMGLVQEISAPQFLKNAIFYNITD
jgi:ATP-dependent protease ClpP protease subunit